MSSRPVPSSPLASRNVQRNVFRQVFLGELGERPPRVVFVLGCHKHNVWSGVGIGRRPAGRAQQLAAFERRHRYRSKCRWMRADPPAGVKLRSLFPSASTPLEVIASTRSAITSTRRPWHFMLRMPMLRYCTHMLLATPQ